MANCRVCTEGAENSMHVCITCRESVDNCSICYATGKVSDGYDNFDCWACKDHREAIEEVDNA